MSCVEVEVVLMLGGGGIGLADESAFRVWGDVSKDILKSICGLRRWLWGVLSADGLAAGEESVRTSGADSQLPEDLAQRYARLTLCLQTAAAPLAQNDGVSGLVGVIHTLCVS